MEQEQMDYILGLIKTRTARFVYNFKIQSYPSSDWRLIKSLPTASNDHLRAIVTTWVNRANPELVLRYEVLECNSIQSAHGYFDGLRSRSTGGNIYKAGDKSAFSDLSLVQQSQASFVEERDGGLHSLAMVRFNLVFVLEALNGPLPVDSLGDLAPNGMLRKALQNKAENSRNVSILPRTIQLKAGEQLELQLLSKKADANQLWYFFISDCPATSCEIMRDKDRLVVQAMPEVQPGKYKLFAAWFDHSSRKSIGSPIELELLA